MKSKDINETQNNKSHLENKNSFPQTNLINKSSNLLELLKARKGQNINIDISMLSNKGSLTNLIEKAKKYQIHPNSKIFQNKSQKEINIEQTNKKIELNDTQKEMSIKPNKKISNQIEILEKFSKIMNKNEKISDNKNNENIENKNDKKNKKDDSQSPNLYNVLSYKTSSSGTRTKSDQISNKEKVESSSQQGQEQEEYIYEEIESNSSTKTQTKKHSKKSSDISDNNNYINNKKQKKSKNNTNEIQETNDYNDDTFAIEYETVKDNYSIKSCNTVLEYSFREDQNIDSQANMEDKSKSIENFNNSKDQMLFELFDGHGGEDISNFLQQNFAQIYKQYLEINNYDIPKSLSYSFKEADKLIKESLNNVDGMGSTGTIIHLFWEKKNKLMVYTANVGDSRVSLISPTHIIRLSYDHRMSDEKEKERILEAGVEVEENRIGGELMLTRIFGDYEFKDKKNKNGLICEPFLSKIKIDLNIVDQFLILASDGIWDLVTEKEIQQMIKKNNNSEKLCARIIKKAIDKESWDNMSVFVIRLT